MLDSPRSESPTSPTPDIDSKAWVKEYFCRFPGCNKSYASTDGVRKHCRKHHADWLAELDAQMRENNLKHSAANYCTTEPAEPPTGEFATPSHTRKRQRADSGASTIALSTPGGTPRLEPTAPLAEPTAFEISSAGGSAPPALAPVRTAAPTKEEIFGGVACWPPFGADDDGMHAQRGACEATDRPLLSALAALDEPLRSSAHKGRERNFFSLSTGMPVPKRGLSLTAEAMAELAREADLDAARSEVCVTGLADLNSFLKEELPPLPASPDHRALSDGFIHDVWA